MTKNERQVIQEVCDYFEYHNKNTTRAQDNQIDKLRELLVAWKKHYRAAGKTEAAAAARAKYWKKFKRTHKKYIKEQSKKYYEANRERILAKQAENRRQKKKLASVGK